MKKLKVVFSFEFNELIRKKAMLISTLLIALIAFGLTFAPRIIDHFAKDNAPYEEEYSLDGVILVAEDEELLDYIKTIFAPFDQLSYLDSEDRAQELIQDEDFDTAYLIRSKSSFVVMEKDSGFDFKEGLIMDVLSQAIINEKLVESGIDPGLVAQAQQVDIDIDYITLGKDASRGFSIAFPALFALYMMIILYGQLVATSVAKEKDSRTMELLITSTDPKTLILGKVFAAGLVGFLQVAFIFAIGALGLLINKGTFPPELMDLLAVEKAMDLFLVYVAFSFSGYMLYLFIFAALGSMVSKLEDVSSAVAPITIVFFIAYFIAAFAIGNPNAALVRVTSFVPFISVFTMPIRYLMTSIPFSEIAISLALMAILIVITAKLSIYIYRLGSLNYGNKMKLTSIFRDIFKKNNNNTAS